VEQRRGGIPFNVAHLVGSPAFLVCGGITGDCAPPDLAMFKNPNFTGGNPIPFNDPANTMPLTVNTTQNVPARVSYLGYRTRGRGFFFDGAPSPFCLAALPYGSIAG
jgi:hypothetical protein